MNSEINKKVEQIKNSFTNSGVPLVKSNRFSQEEIDGFLSATGNRQAKNYLGKDAKIWSDEEIAQQLEIRLNQKVISEPEIRLWAWDFLKRCEMEDFEVDKKLFQDSLYKLVNWSQPLDFDFWQPFGHISPTIDDKSPLIFFREKYGACGLNEILGDKKGLENYMLLYLVTSTLKEFDEKWKSRKKSFDTRKMTFSSPFNSLCEIEDNVVLSQVQVVARDFYMDKSKDFEERIKVFDLCGKKDGYIYRPQDYDLASVFSIYFTHAHPERHEILFCSSIVKDWIEQLSENRILVSSWNNSTSPVLTETKRNYKPSKEASQRLFRYYMERLFANEISSFELDW